MAHMLYVIGTLGAARDLHIIAARPLEHMCWRQFMMQWGNCKKSRIAPFHAIIIIIIIYCYCLIVWMKGNRRTIRTSEWQITRGERSVGRWKCHWRDDCLTTKINMVKDSEEHKEFEDSCGGLLPIVAGHHPEWNKTDSVAKWRRRMYLVYGM